MKAYPTIIPLAIYTLKQGSYLSRNSLASGDDRSIHAFKDVWINGLFVGRRSVLTMISIVEKWRMDFGMKYHS